MTDSIAIARSMRGSIGILAMSWLMSDDTNAKAQAAGMPEGLGAYAIWTITIEPAEDGSTVIFDEVATAPPGSNMTEMAKAVDYVKGEGIRRLAGLDAG